MKITRIELCHPVNRPGKRDDNYRELPPPGAKSGAYTLTIGVDFGHGVLVVSEGGRSFIPMSNIKSIDYEETKKK